MNTKDLITLLREEIEKTNVKCYSPDLPQDVEKCCSIKLGDCKNIKALNGETLYSEIAFSITVRGTSDDNDTRAIVDKILNKLDYNTDVSNEKVRVFLIKCNTLSMLGRDEKQNIYYKMEGNLKVEWSDNNV